MRGISLSIETVILLILAVVVLAALLMFLSASLLPVQREVELQRKQNELCFQIVQTDPGCNYDQVKSIADRFLDTSFNNPPVCSNERPGCKGTSSQECIRTCCSTYCGRR